MSYAVTARNTQTEKKRRNTTMLKIDLETLLKEVENSNMTSLAKWQLKKILNDMLREQQKHKELYGETCPYCGHDFTVPVIFNHKMKPSKCPKCGKPL
jgi:predicted Zn-ribbon and HTH transcriptional regulator